MTSTLGVDRTLHMEQQATTVGGRLSIIFVWTLIGGIAGGVAFLEASNYEYRWKNRNDYHMWSSKWSRWDFRLAKDAVYTPFARGALWGFAIGSVVGLVIAGKQE